MASLADVGRLAGTSIATASRVLNGSSHPVSEDTRRRVLDAAERLGYSPSALARALVTRSSHIVGLIVNDIVDPYFNEIARGVDDVAARAGYLTITCNADRRSATELAHVRLLRDYEAEGIIFAGCGSDQDVDAAALNQAVGEIRTGGTPVFALAHREFASNVVAIDNRAAGYDITDYLISLGHRRIAYVEGPEHLYTSLQRHEGFVAAMKDAGLPHDERYDGGFDFESGLAAAARIGLGRALPDAIVAANDELAIGILTGLRQSGVSIPDEVSVAGIDGTRPSRFVELTTVSIPLYELGAVAARAIVSRGESKVDNDPITLTHRLTPRSTTTRRR